RQRGGHAEQGPGSEGEENDEYQWKLPLAAEEGIQRDQLVVLDCKPEKQEEQQQADDPDDCAHGRHYPRAINKKEGGRSRLPLLPVEPIAARSIADEIHPFAQFLARLEMRDIF